MGWAWLGWGGGGVNWCLDLLIGTFWAGNCEIKIPSPFSNFEQNHFWHLVHQKCWKSVDQIQSSGTYGHKSHLGQQKLHFPI